MTSDVRRCVAQPAKLTPWRAEARPGHAITGHLVTRHVSF